MRKTCYTCKQVKPRDEFYKDAKNTDGRKGSCKSCVIERAKESYAKRKHITS